MADSYKDDEVVVLTTPPLPSIAYVASPRLVDLALADFFAKQLIEAPE